MKRKLSIFATAVLLLVLAGSATAKPADASIPEKCDSSWRSLRVPESETNDLILIKPFGDIFVAKNGTVFAIYSREVSVKRRKTYALALLYWTTRGAKVAGGPALGYTPEANRGSFSGNYIQALSATRGRIVIGGKYTTNPTPGALNHPRPLLFEWNGRQLLNVAPAGLGEAEIYSLEGEWAFGRILSSPILPLALQRGEYGWNQVPTAEFTPRPEYEPVPETLVSKEQLERSLGVSSAHFQSSSRNERWEVVGGYTDKSGPFLLRRQVCGLASTASG